MLEWQYAFHVAIDIARALEAAFERGIIHRNITPTNILVRSSDRLAKLGDLMLAKALSGTLARQITRPGELVGDVHYMSPERTQSQADVDTRSDIYSLGATLYAVLAGRPPFEGKSLPEVIGKIRGAEPVPPKKYQLSIYDLFENIVLRMLQKRPDDRYQTPAELLSELQRIGGYRGITV
jgi:serine/threonine-protein kinase